MRSESTFMHSERLVPGVPACLDWCELDRLYLDNSQASLKCTYPTLRGQSDVPKSTKIRILHFSHGKMRLT